MVSDVNKEDNFEIIKQEFYAKPEMCKHEIGCKEMNHWGITSGDENLTYHYLPESFYIVKKEVFLFIRLLI